MAIHEKLLLPIHIHHTRVHALLLMLPFYSLHPLHFSYPTLHFLNITHRHHQIMANAKNAKAAAKKAGGGKGVKKRASPAAAKGAAAAGGIKGSKTAVSAVSAKSRVTPKKPKARVLRLLKAKEPKVVEGGKQALFLKGTKCPELLQTVLRDLVRMFVCDQNGGDMCYTNSYLIHHTYPLLPPSLPLLIDKAPQTELQDVES